MDQEVVVKEDLKEDQKEDLQEEVKVDQKEELNHQVQEDKVVERQAEQKEVVLEVQEEVLIGNNQGEGAI